MKRWTYPEGTLYLGNCLKLLPKLPEQSVDLVLGSPPYEDCRTYGIDFDLKGQDWVDWMVEVFRASLRVCKGLVAYVVEGKTEQYRYSCTPALLMADLHRAGIHLRKPVVYRRNGIMGSGGPDWLRNDWEWILCATNGGRLPWSDNVACGHPPKYGAGGSPSHRDKVGKRLTDKKRALVKKLMVEEGISQREAIRQLGMKMDWGSDGYKDGDTNHILGYIPPEKSNPGNVLDCGTVGGGRIGSNIAHDNEAPFPEKIPNFFIRSFCPPGGVVLDPFSGSGTTLAVAIKTGRKFIACDLRESQIALMQRRIKQARNRKGFGL